LQEASDQTTDLNASSAGVQSSSQGPSHPTEDAGKAKGGGLTY